MMPIAVAGSLDYLRKGVAYLTANGYPPSIVIERSKDVDDCIENHAATIRDEGVQLLVCLAYPEILKRDVLRLFPRGCINFHAGLPKYRGRHPVNWMLIDGIEEIPVAVHYMDEGIDTGDIIVEASIPVTRDETYVSVMEKITAVEGPMLLSAVRQIEAGVEQRRKQDKATLGYTKKRSPADSAFGFEMSSERVHRFINALTDPMPNAFTHDESARTITFQQSYRGERAGEVLARCEDGRFVVSTGDGVVLVRSNSNLVVGQRFSLS